MFDGNSRTINLNKTRTTEAILSVSVPIREMINT